MEQIIKMAQDVYERRLQKIREICDYQNAEKERINKEAKELLKLVIRLFGASNKEKGDYRIDNIMVNKSEKSENFFCMVTFEKDKKDGVQTYTGYYELINLPYISKAIDKINHQKFDPKVLYATMEIIDDIENYRISSWNKGDYGETAEYVAFGI